MNKTIKSLFASMALLLILGGCTININQGENEESEVEKDSEVVKTIEADENIEVVEIDEVAVTTVTNTNFLYEKEVSDCPPTGETSKVSSFHGLSDRHISCADMGWRFEEHLLANYGGNLLHYSISTGGITWQTSSSEKEHSLVGVAQPEFGCLLDVQNVVVSDLELDGNLLNVIDDPILFPEGGCGAIDLDSFVLAEDLETATFKVKDQSFQINFQSNSVTAL